MKNARDATGRQVSLLNDVNSLDSTAARAVYTNQYFTGLGRSATASPLTPALMRSDSYDSQISSEPLSPLTPRMANTDYNPLSPYCPYFSPYSPAAVYASGPGSPYEGYMPFSDPMSEDKRPGNIGDRRSASIEDEEMGMGNPGAEAAAVAVAAMATATAAAPAAATTAAVATAADKPGKRYPCRYRDTHGCEKSFTTSGHASRHSKIHTAEKAVQCTFRGCSKKFTRADNMKQHLETHYKDKTRAAARPPLRRQSASKPCGLVKTSPRATPQPTPMASPMASPPLMLASPEFPCWTNARTIPGLTLLSRPSATRMTSSGLDTLALAAAHMYE